MTTTIPPTENTAWGFWGTMGERAAAAWPLAFTAIQEATGCEPDAVRAFLDSPYGRHFADDVTNRQSSGRPLADAIARSTATHMAWRISRRRSLHTGIPAGTPFLTAYVTQAGILAEATDEEA